MRHAVALVLLLIAGFAAAADFDALGQRMKYANPEGYCPFGNSEPERTMWRNTEKAIAPGARLAYASAPCTELAALRSGRSDRVDHWLLIQIIGAKGEFRRLDVPREQFLAAFSKAVPTLTPEDVAKRLRSVLTDLTASDLAFTPIGRDGNAVYYTSRMTLELGGVSRQITALSAMTLVNSVPIAIHVYEATGHPNSKQSLDPLLRASLTSLLSSN